MRKERKWNWNYIYKITCTINRKYYIGMHSTNNLEDGYFGSGKRLKHSVNKYGKRNHTLEILEYFKTRKEVANRESELVTEELIKRDDLCLNLKPGGFGGGGFSKDKRKLGTKNGLAAQKILKETNPEWYDKINEKISIKAKERWKNSPEIFKDFTYDWTGKSHSDETKKKMSAKAKLRVGNKNSQFGTCWITKENETKKIPKEELEIWINEGWKRGRK